MSLSLRSNGLIPEDSPAARLDAYFAVTEAPAAAAAYPTVDTVLGTLRREAVPVTLGESPLFARQIRVYSAAGYTDPLQRLPEFRTYLPCFSTQITERIEVAAVQRTFFGREDQRTAMLSKSGRRGTFTNDFVNELREFYPSYLQTDPFLSMCRQINTADTVRVSIHVPIISIREGTDGNTFCVYLHREDQPAQTDKQHVAAKVYLPFANQAFAMNRFNFSGDIAFSRHEGRVERPLECRVIPSEVLEKLGQSQDKEAQNLLDNLFGNYSAVIAYTPYITDPEFENIKKTIGSQAGNDARAKKDLERSCSQAVSLYPTVLRHQLEGTYRRIFAQTELANFKNEIHEIARRDVEAGRSCEERSGTAVAGYPEKYQGTLSLEYSTAYDQVIKNMEEVVSAKARHDARSYVQDSETLSSQAVRFYPAQFQGRLRAAYEQAYNQAKAFSYRVGDYGLRCGYDGGFMTMGGSGEAFYPLSFDDSDYSRAVPMGVSSRFVAKGGSPRRQAMGASSRRQPSSWGVAQLASRTVGSDLQVRQAPMPAVLEELQVSVICPLPVTEEDFIGGGTTAAALRDRAMMIRDAMAQRLAANIAGPAGDA